MMLIPVEPIYTVELFPGLSAELLDVLRGLPPETWGAPTACPGWSVKDVAAHLLGGTLGRLSGGRDRPVHPHQQGGKLGFEALLKEIDRENAEWVEIARRFSPRLLVDFIALTDPQLYEYFKSLPPFEPAGPEVAWAGDTESPNWFDIAREYTEKWLHQQHIREAAGYPVLAERQWLDPVLDTFLRALPYTYRSLEAAQGTTIGFRITGAAGGDWALRRALRREERAWRLYAGTAGQAAARVTLDQDTAWRLFTRGLHPALAEERIRREGDLALSEPVLGMVSIMA
jgi:uncharacterized protein (TIGR03083 family)